MTYSSSYQETQPYDADTEPITISTFPGCHHLATHEHICRFELLRLALFVLKLSKLEQRSPPLYDEEEKQTYELRRSLLRHVIFQQLLRLTELGAAEQAKRLIAACRR